MSMKQGSVIAAAMCAWAAAFGAPTIDDGVMTITEAGNLSEVLSASDLAALTGNTVTNVNVNLSMKSKALTNDTALAAYTGAWTITRGIVAAGVASGAFGSGTTDEAAVTITAPDGQIWVPENMAATVSNPVKTRGNGSDGWKPVYIDDRGRNATTKLTLTGKLTLSTACTMHFQGKADLYCQGGFEQTGGTVSTLGANGHWVVETVPCTVERVKINWLYLDLKVAGNAIKVADLNEAGKLRLYVDDALAGYPTRVVNCVASSAVTLNGHDALVGEIAYWTAGEVTSTGAATLTISNDTDVAVATPFNGKASLRKIGTGKLTLTSAANGTEGTLEVAEGNVTMDPAARWMKATGVTLSGGTLTLGDSESFGNGQAALTVTDAAATGVLAVPDGCLQYMASVTWAGLDRGIGTFGGAASIAGTKLAFFTDTDTGMLNVDKTLLIHLDTGVKTNLADAVSADVLAAINANGYTCIEKRGAGTLVLDQALTYSGHWVIRHGTVQATAPQGAFGVAAADGRPDDITVLLATANRITIGVAGQDTYVDKPIRLVDSRTSSECLGTYGKVHLTKLLTAEGTVGVNIVVYGSSTVGEFHTEGGLKCSGKQIEGNAAGGHWYWHAPVDVGMLKVPWLTHHFTTPSNRIDNIHTVGSNTLRLECDDAFPFLPNLDLGYSINGAGTQSSSDLNMLGHDMDVDAFTCRGTPSIPVLRNTGARMATLSFRNATPYTNHNLKVTGAVSFVKGGEALYCVDTVYGDTGIGSLSVTNGTFAFLAAGSWLGCTNVTVTGAASMLELNASTNLAGRVDIALADGGRLALAEGVEQSIGNLWRDGKPVGRSGTYGSSASPAEHKDDQYFTGGGVVRVHSTWTGTVISFK